MKLEKDKKYQIYIPKWCKPGEVHDVRVQSVWDDKGDNGEQVTLAPDDSEGIPGSPMCVILYDKPEVSVEDDTEITEG